jgi:hypothetical protein
VTIVRERHAFEGKTLCVINSIKRRGILLVLVILPNGSRSLIPATWTDWRATHASASPADADGNDASRLGRLDDLLQLGKLIDALARRHIESAPHMESPHADELGVPRTTRSAREPCGDLPVSGRMDPTRRGSPDRCSQAARNTDRPHARRKAGGPGGEP